MESLIGPRVAPVSSVRLVVDEQSQVGAARRAAVELAHANLVGADAIARLAIVVTEASTNIIRHAGHGIIILRALRAGPTPAVEVLALDKGSGIASLPRAMRDGFSTSGTPGHGLGAIRRLASVFAIYSHRDTGTALMARVGDEPRLAVGTQRAPSVDDRVGVVCVPLRGESACGDAWRVIVGRQRLSVLLVDGLGHGPQAAVAAVAAVESFGSLASGSTEAALAAMHGALRGTRGAALSSAVIDEAERTVTFSGVGNVDGRVLSLSQGDHLSPQNGIVGHTMPTPRTTSSAWPAGGRLVMHSDGISARWHMDAYPGLLKAHPALLAGVIYRDFARETDDATVLVIADGVGEERGA